MDIKKLVLAGILLIAGTAFGQAVRYDSIAQVLTANNLYTPVSNGTVLVYNYPGATTNCATAGTCTLATTYIDETMITSCGTSVPLTRPTFNSCTGSTDAGANFGFWIKPGQYQYCISGTGVATSCNNITVGVYSLGSKTFVLATASGTATVDLASVASGACTADSADVTLTGAAVGDPVRVTAATALPAGAWLIGRVTASNTGRFQLCNLSGGAVDRASDTYTISVVK